MARFSAENASKSIWRPGSAQICWEAYSPPQIPELDLKGKRPPGKGFGRGKKRRGEKGREFFFFFSSPNLSGRRLDVCHTSTHGVALV